jgi:hypothetical protein
VHDGGDDRTLGVAGAKFNAAKKSKRTSPPRQRAGRRPGHLRMDLDDPRAMSGAIEPNVHAARRARLRSARRPLDDEVIWTFVIDVKRRLALVEGEQSTPHLIEGLRRNALRRLDAGRPLAQAPDEIQIEDAVDEHHGQQHPDRVARHRETEGEGDGDGNAGGSEAADEHQENARPLGSQRVVGACHPHSLVQETGYPLCAMIRCCLLVVLCLSSVVTAFGQQPLPGKRKLGPEINTAPFREILPIIAADGKTLYFVREDKGEEIASQINGQANAAVADLEKTIATITDPAMRKQMEDLLKDLRKTQVTRTDLGLLHQTIWFSEKQANGAWGPAKRMPAPLSHDVDTIWIGSILPDNNTMLVAGQVNGDMATRWQQTADEWKNADPFAVLRAMAPTSNRDPNDPPAEKPTKLFAWSHRTANGWSPPDLLKFRGFRNDSPRLEIFLAPDGRHTLFSIHNAESLGIAISISTLRRMVSGTNREPRRGRQHEVGRTVAVHGARRAHALFLERSARRTGRFRSVDDAATRRDVDEMVGTAEPGCRGQHARQRHEHRGRCHRHVCVHVDRSDDERRHLRVCVAGRRAPATGRVCVRTRHRS